MAPVQHTSPLHLSHEPATKVFLHSDGVLFNELVFVTGIRKTEFGYYARLEFCRRFPSGVVYADGYVVVRGRADEKVYKLAVGLTVFLRTLSITD